MNRKSFLTQTLMMTFALLAVSLPAWAQAKKQAIVGPGILRIHEVSKRDVPDARAGQKKQVPVSVKVSWEPIIAEAKLAELQMELVTLNTDGTKTIIHEKYDKLLSLHEMTLPMANGVFAKSFTLNVRATILLNGKRDILRASKSGNF